MAAPLRTRQDAADHKPRNLMAKSLLPGLAFMLGQLLAMAPMAGARASDLHVAAGGGLSTVLGELGPAFERASGHKVSISFAATPDLIKQLSGGAPFDLAVVPSDVMIDTAARARFATGPMATVARVGFGVAVRAGTPKPNVGSAAALKKTLLAAKSIATLPASAAGAYVLKVFERLGIAEEMKARIKVQASPGQIPQAVAKGEADLGVFLINVLQAPGVEFAGPFPGDLQQDLVYVGAITTDAKAGAAAQAFLDFLKSPSAIAVMKAKGVTPG
jgi:molybdate transport system substrate-binding protein